MISTLCVAPLWGGRIYDFRGSIDLPLGIDDNPALGMLQTRDRSFKFVYGFAPSVVMRSRGEFLNYQLSYATGFDRVQGSNLDLNSQSQVFEGNASAALTPKLKVRVSESYIRSPDFTAFNLLRGNVSPPEGAFPRSDIVALRRNSYSNAAAVSLDYTLDPRSGLSVGFGHFLRKFERNSVVDNQFLDQDVSSGNVQYTRKINRRTSWNFGYSMYQYNFQVSGDARTHNANVGVEHQLSRTVSVSLVAGPSYTQFLKPSSGSSGYNTFANLTGSLEKDRLSLTYHRRNGANFGIGSLADTQDLSVNYFRSVGKRTSLNGAIMLYSARQRLEDRLENRGSSASLIFNFLASTHWALSLGCSYQRQNGADIFDLQRKRVFGSIKFILPEFLRFEK